VWQVVGCVTGTVTGGFQTVVVVWGPVVVGWLTGVVVVGWLTGVVVVVFWGVDVVGATAAAWDMSPTPTPPEAAAKTKRDCAIRRERSMRRSRRSRGRRCGIYVFLLLFGNFEGEGRATQGV